MLKFQHYCSDQNVTCRKTGYTTFFEDFFSHYQEVKQLIKRFLNSRQVWIIKKPKQEFQDLNAIKSRKTKDFSALILLKTADFCEFNIRLLWVQSTLIRVYIYIHNILTLIMHIYTIKYLYIFTKNTFFILRTVFQKRPVFCYGFEVLKLQGFLAHFSNNTQI